MMAWVNLDEELVNQALQQIEQWHNQTHGTGANSLVWAMAHEQFAKRMNEAIAQDQTVKARLSLKSDA